LKNKKLLIIGGSGRLGTYLIQNLKGIRIINLDIKKSSRKSRNIKHIYLRDDLLKKSEINAIARCLPKIDYIISATNFRTNQETSSILELFALLIFPVELILSLIAANKINKGCSIIFFGSSNSKYISQRSVWYHISKRSLRIVAKLIASKLKNKAATVNVVSPGIISYKKNGKIPDVEKMNILNKKPVEPKQLLNIIKLLWSCSSINCEEINIDGGYNIIDPFHFFQKI
jgi:NAD(P)-dependent dehydrogenase (short-subunit alcohol dehydrogenase family)